MKLEEKTLNPDVVRGFKFDESKKKDDSTLVHFLGRDTAVMRIYSTIFAWNPTRLLGVV